MTDALFRLVCPDGATRLAAGPAEKGPKRLLAPELSIDSLLSRTPHAVKDALADAANGESVPAGSRLVAPVESQEVWAAGVTYLRSRDARVAESVDGDPYTRVYDAVRPEVFFKAPGWRVRGPDETIGVRRDSAWNVPEPELALVLTSTGAIAGYTIGNDVSSRSIEGENPLYLPQAKVYDGSCAIGPCIVPAGSVSPPFRIGIVIARGAAVLYRDSTTTDQLRRTFDELVGCVASALTFPVGAVLLTGTCLVPSDDVTLTAGDRVDITIDGLGTLSNTAASVGLG
jgi:2-dehydro-3-deoxy-D-arabinonate dehydratase